MFTVDVLLWLPEIFLFNQFDPETKNRLCGCSRTFQNDLSDSILHSMQRSRRLVFVLSPDFLLEKSFSLLECRLGLYLQHGNRAAIVSVVFRSVSKLPCVEVAQLRQAAAAAVTWRGSRSEPRRSRFWLRLRLALPVRPLALGRRLIDSTSSHSDLAALALQRVQRNQNQNQNQNQRDGAYQSRRNRRASANQSRRLRQAPPRGRSRVKREEQRSRKCSGCSAFIGQEENRGAELTELQQMSHDRTEIRSDPVPETEPVPIRDPSPAPITDSGSAPVSDSAPISASDPAPIPDSDPAPTPDSDSALPTCRLVDNGAKHKQQQLIGSGTCEET